MRISFARSFDASCHSFVIVFGGGGAAKSHIRVSLPATRCKHPERTERAGCEPDDTGCSEETRDTERDLERRAGRVDGCARAVRAEGDVVGCWQAMNITRGYGMSGKGNIPAFFSARESSFQFFFWSSSSCSWTATWSSLLMRSHCASMFASGMAARGALDAAADVVGWAAAVARPRRATRTA